MIDLIDVLVIFLLNSFFNSFSLETNSLNPTNLTFPACIWDLSLIGSQEESVRSIAEEPLEWHSRLWPRREIHTLAGIMAYHKKLLLTPENCACGECHVMTPTILGIICE